jgi:hypothetical protein
VIFVALLLIASPLQHLLARRRSNLAAIDQVEKASPGEPGDTERQLIGALTRAGLGKGGPRTTVLWIQRIALGAIALLAIGVISVGSQVDPRHAFHRALVSLTDGDCIVGSYVARGNDQVVLAQPESAPDDGRGEWEPKPRIAIFSTDEVREVQIYAEASDDYPIERFPGCADHPATVNHPGHEKKEKDKDKTEDEEKSEAEVAEEAVNKPPLDPPPETIEIKGVGTDGGGIPIVNWKLGGEIKATTCPRANLRFAVLIDGDLVYHGEAREIPGSNGHGGATTEYIATYPPLYPGHGKARVVFSGICRDETAAVIEFDIRIDPRGTVVYTNGHPVAGATVTLLGSSAPGGPFLPLPDGSRRMSAESGVNPETTGANGRFAWETASGYYVVRATKPGCRSVTDASNPGASSGVLRIPPPARGVILVLDCRARPLHSAVSGSPAERQ